MSATSRSGVGQPAGRAAHGGPRRIAWPRIEPPPVARPPIERPSAWLSEARLLAPRCAPVLIAGALSLIYVLAAPPSSDLAAVLLRVRLGLSLWNNWWYGGHYTLSYSVLLVPLAAVLGAQLAGALAATCAAALFQALVHRAFGRGGWLGASWFAVGAAAALYSGRLAFVLGLAFGLAAALGLQRRRPALAIACAALASLSSPVAAVFTALAGTAFALARPDGVTRRTRERSRLAGPAAGWRALLAGPAAGWGVVLAALAPAGALAIAFPGAGSEPFAGTALAPLPPLAALLAGLAPPEQRALRLGALLYGALCVATFLIPSPFGGNAARLGELAAGPLLALVLHPRRSRWLALAAPTLVYMQLQAPVRDLLASASSPTASAGYWRVLARFLERAPGRPFRVEIAFTALHWEAYYLARAVPLARGWERQLDTGYDHLFYGRASGLTPRSYRRWLDGLAVRYVVVPSAPLDYSSRREAALIAGGLPYLHLVWRSHRFRVYAVAHPAPLAQGAATAVALGPGSVRLRARRSGAALVRVRYSPYWALTVGAGCVAPAGAFTRITVTRPGALELGMRFAPDRIGARSARCTSGVGQTEDRPNP